MRLTTIVQLKFNDHARLLKAQSIFLPLEEGKKEKVNSGASNLCVYTVTPIIRVMRHIKFGSCNIQINFYWVSSVYVLSLEFRLSSLKTVLLFRVYCADKINKKSQFICGAYKLSKLNELIDSIYKTNMEFIATLKTMEMLSLSRAEAIKRIASWLSMIPLLRQLRINDSKSVTDTENPFYFD